MKKDKKIIVALSIAIVVILIGMGVAVFLLLQQKEDVKKPSDTTYAVTTTQGTTAPLDTESWVDFEDIASNLATATDPSTTIGTTVPGQAVLPVAPGVPGVSGGPVAPPTTIISPVPATTIIYVDANGNVIDWREPTDPNAPPITVTVPVSPNTPNTPNTTVSSTPGVTEESDFEISSKGMIIGYRGGNKHILIPKEVDGIKVIGVNEGCFKNSDIKSVYFFDTLSKIGKEAFAGCKSLDTVGFVQGAHIELGEGAFKNCPKLEKVELPVVEKMGKGVFENCTSLKEVGFYKGSLTIGDFAFAGCKNLSIVKVPDSVEAEYIGQDIFKGCDKKKLVVIAPTRSDIITYAKDNKILYKES